MIQGLYQYLSSVIILQQFHIEPPNPPNLRLALNLETPTPKNEKRERERNKNNNACIKKEILEPLKPWNPKTEASQKKRSPKPQTLNPQP